MYNTMACEHGAPRDLDLGVGTPKVLSPVAQNRVLGLADGPPSSGLFFSLAGRRCILVVLTLTCLLGLRIA